MIKLIARLISIIAGIAASIWLFFLVDWKIALCLLIMIGASETSAVERSKP